MYTYGTEWFLVAFLSVIVCGKIFLYCAAVENICNVRATVEAPAIIKRLIVK